MSNRTGNYTAFYVSEPFSLSNLGAHATKDFVTYNQLKSWKGLDPSFPFVDSHDKNYSVRDNSNWDTTLKPRLRDRLSKSKNIIFILSSITLNSRALREEIDYGINICELPVIIIYPEYKENSDIVDCENKIINAKIKSLWNNVPVFRDSMSKVPTIHIPNNKAIIEKTFNNSNFNVATKRDPGIFIYPCS
jgi:hypothetical protein